MTLQEDTDNSTRLRSLSVKTEQLEWLAHAGSRYKLGFPFLTLKALYALGLSQDNSQKNVSNLHHEHINKYNTFLHVLENSVLYLF